jgi:hypothetical protein
MFRTVNIKEDNPNVDYAMYLLDEEIRYSKGVGNRVILVIHGHGSHGQGGLIRLEIRNYLPMLKKKGIIKDYVFGDNWGDLNESKQKICEIAPELIINSNVRNINSGVSVILI